MIANVSPHDASVAGFGRDSGSNLGVAMLVLALWAATSTHHKLRANEREHLNAAAQFVRDRAAAIGTIPAQEEFERWIHDMDAKGYRFEGNGFALDERCGSKAFEFCISFSAGGDFVTYRSWQRSMEEVTFDDSPLPLAFGLLLLGLVAAICAKCLLLPQTHAPSAGVA